MSKEVASPSNVHRARPARSPLARLAWTALGCLLLALGAVGVVLPGLPTTPFLILAAACFVRSSQRLYDRILAHKTFGPLVRDFREGRGLARRTKWVAISTMWVFVGFALVWGLPEGRTALRWVVGTAAVMGTAYLLHLPTAPARRTLGEPTS